ncbi:MAG: TolC family protein [Gemmatimonadaceae bacterium]|nr:TolC family protein [Gemmatimonadaceae bacterium]
MADRHPRARRAVRHRIARTVLLLVAPLAVVPLAAQDRAPVALTLGEAARLAARQGAAAQAAQLRVTQAESRVAQRRADLLPQVNGAVQVADRTFNSATLGIDIPAPPGQPPFFNPDGEVLGPVPTSDVRGTIRQTLLDPAVLARLRAARGQVAASAADVATNELQVAAQAGQAYIQAQRAERILAARGADSVLAAALLTIAQNQLRAGTGVVLDVTRAQSQLSAIRAQLIAARNDRDKSQLALRRALNLPLDQPVITADSLDAAEELAVADVATAVDAAIRTRPEVRALTAQAQAARLAEIAVQAERWPSLGLVADNGFIGGGRTFGNLLNTYAWGVQLSVPVFDGARREARIREQEAVQRELELRRGDAAAQVATELRSALLDADAAREQVAAARERVALAEQEVAQARSRFTAGVTGNLDVTQALLSLSTARTQFVDALAARQQARLAVARAQGTITALR